MKLHDTTGSGTKAVSRAQTELAYVKRSLSEAVFMLGVVAVLQVTAHAQCTAWSHQFMSNGIDATSGPVLAMAVFNDGAGDALFIGGGFSAAGPLQADGLVKWTATGWAPVSMWTGGVVASMLTYDDGSGLQLYVGGNFFNGGGVNATNIAHWNGNTWSALGAGVGGSTSFVNAMETYDDGTGPAIYVGGFFSTAGLFPSNNIARWKSGWTTFLGMDIPSPWNASVNALKQYDDGSGPALYAGGMFSSAGGTPASSIARWDGSQWTEVGGGLAYELQPVPPTAESFCVFNDGGGPALYVGGRFTRAGGVSASHVAKWDGTQWSPLGAGLNGPVRTLSVFDDGTGPALYAGGSISVGFQDYGVAKWNGTMWVSVGGGCDNSVSTSAVYDAGNGAELFIGGALVVAGGVSSPHIAKLEQCGSPTSFCYGDGSLPTDCPCLAPNTVPAPPAAVGHGCANSLNPDGALLSATGVAFPDTLALSALVSSNYVGFGLMLKGDGSASAGIASADGIRCVDGQLIRFGAHFAGTNGASQGYWTYPNTVQTNAVSIQTAQPPGQTAYYQLFYRNAAANFCTAATTNWSNGIQIAWP